MLNCVIEGRPLDAVWFEARRLRVGFSVYVYMCVCVCLGMLIEARVSNHMCGFLCLKHMFQDNTVDYSVCCLFQRLL